MMNESSPALLRRIRFWLGFFMIGLVLSGVIAFPLQYEIDWLVRIFPAAPAAHSGLAFWIQTVHEGLQTTYARYPWVAYGTDWLAFAHLVIAIFFIGPFINPVRNVWVLQAGMVACVLVLPMALLCGPLRHIPLGWRLIDCTFGLGGIVPLYYIWHLTRKLEQREIKA
jgi:hypothetical protein